MLSTPSECNTELVPPLENHITMSWSKLTKPPQDMVGNSDTSPKTKIIIYALMQPIPCGVQALILDCMTRDPMRFPLTSRVKQPMALLPFGFLCFGYVELLQHQTYIYCVIQTLQKISSKVVFQNRHNSDLDCMTKEPTKFPLSYRAKWIAEYFSKSYSPRLSNPILLISLGSIVQWKHCWLSNPIMGIPSIVACHLWRKWNLERDVINLNLLELWSQIYKVDNSSVLTINCNKPLHKNKYYSKLPLISLAMLWTM